jgi:hypothetical protein
VLEQIFKSVPFIVDTDNSFGCPARRCGWCPTGTARPLWRGEGQVLDSIGALMGGR